TGAFAFGDSAGTSGSFGGVVNVMPKRAQKQNLNSVSAGRRMEQNYLAADFSRRFRQDRMGWRINVVESNGATNVEGEERLLQLATLGFDYYYDNFRISADAGYQNHELDATTPSINVASGRTVPFAP